MCVHCLVLGNLIKSGSHTIDITMIKDHDCRGGDGGFLVHIIGPRIPKEVQPLFVMMYNKHTEFVAFGGGFKGIVFQCIDRPTCTYKPQYSVLGLCVAQKKRVAKLVRRGNSAEQINRKFGMTLVYEIPDDCVITSKHGAILDTSKQNTYF